MSRGPVCQNDPYPRYAPGEYLARVVEAKIYRHPGLRAHKCDLRLQLMNGGDFGYVHAFLHLGRNAEPKAGRNSKFYRAFVMASGQVPRKGHRLSPRAFVGKVFRVRVADVTKKSDGASHDPLLVYSIVTELMECVQQ